MWNKEKEKESVENRYLWRRSLLQPAIVMNCHNQGAGLSLADIIALSPLFRIYYTAQVLQCASVQPQPNTLDLSSLSGAPNFPSKEEIVCSLSVSRISSLPLFLCPSLSSSGCSAHAVVVVVGLLLVCCGFNSPLGSQIVPCSSAKASFSLCGGGWVGTIQPKQTTGNLLCGAASEGGTRLEILRGD